MVKEMEKLTNNLNSIALKALTSDTEQQEDKYWEKLFQARMKWYDKYEELKNEEYLEKERMGRLTE